MSDAQPALEAGGVPEPPAREPERSTMVERFGVLARLLIHLAFRHVRVDAAAAARVRLLAAQHPIIYVMRYRSALDHLLVNAVLVREGLPLAHFAPGISTVLWRPIGAVLAWLGRRRGGARRPAAVRCAALVAAGKPVLLFMRSRAVAGRRRRALAAARIGVRYLREVVRQVDGGPAPAPVIVPVAVFRGPGFRRRESRLATMIYSVQEAPGEARRLVTYLWNAEQIRLSFGTPVDLTEFARTHASQSEERRVRQLARTLQIELHREERVVHGPALLPRREVRAQVLRDPELARLTWRLAAERGVKRQKVLREARRYVDEMAANFNGIYFGVLEFLFNRIARVFSGLEITGLERVAERVKQHPVVLVPCHRSHFDYMILTYIFHTHYLSPPHIAAGINLKFWPMGPFLRGAGAFFIRRTFADNDLYKMVFRKYLGFLIREGYTQEFFIEGGRTRSGKMLAPKFGMVSALVEAFAHGRRHDLYFVPVSVHYGRIPEEEVYKREVSGEEKQRESFWALLGARRILSRRYGTVSVAYGEPISLRDELGPRRETLRSGGDGVEREQRLFVEAFGRRLVREVNQITAAGATSVSAAALLGAPHAAMREEEFHESAAALLGVLRTQNVSFTTSLTRNETTGFTESLGWLESGGLLERRRSAGGSVLYVPTDKRPNLDFYKNNILHFFLVPALVARGWRYAGAEGVSGYVERALRWLEWEFTLADRETIARDVARWTDHLRAAGALTDRGAVEDDPTFRAIVGLLENLREAHLVATRTAETTQDWPVSRQGLVRAMRRHFATGLLLGELRRPEGSSIVTFGNVIDRLLALGCLACGEGRQARWLEPGPNYDRVRGLVDELEF